MANLPAEQEKGKDLMAQFKEDSKNMGLYAADFITSYFPAYGVTNEMAVATPMEKSLDLLNTFTFYRICEVTTYDVENQFIYFSEKLKKLFTTAYAIKQEVCYGIVSYSGKTSLVLGVQPKSSDETIKVIIEGLLPGMKIWKYEERFINSTA